MGYRPRDFLKDLREIIGCSEGYAEKGHKSAISKAPLCDQLDESSDSGKQKVGDNRLRIVNNNVHTPSVWSNRILCRSDYMRKYLKGHYQDKYRALIEKSDNLDILLIKPKVFSKQLTLVVLKILKSIKPLELIDFKGFEKGAKGLRHLAHLHNFQNGLCVYVFHVVSEAPTLVGFFLKVSAYLVRVSNYTALSPIIDGLRKSFLDDKTSKKVERYYRTYKNYFSLKHICEEIQTGVKPFLYPANVFFFELASANSLKEKSDSSVKFCEILDTFMFIQKFEYKSRLRRSIQHFILHNIQHSLSQGLNIDDISNESRDKENNQLYLLYL